VDVNSSVDGTTGTPNSIDNFVNFQQIFKVLSLADSWKFAMKPSLEIPLHPKCHYTTLWKI